MNIVEDFSAEVEAKRKAENSERQRRFQQSREEMGLERINIWVPADKVDAFKRFAKDEVAEHKKRIKAHGS